LSSIQNVDLSKMTTAAQIRINEKVHLDILVYMTRRYASKMVDEIKRNVDLLKKNYIYLLIILQKISVRTY